MSGFFFFQAEDGIRDDLVTGVQTCALPILLGGAQSLHTNGMDEAFAIPTEEAMKIALRTQQIIALESNVTNTIDPLAGSYYVENLTTQFESDKIGRAHV